MKLKSLRPELPRGPRGRKCRCRRGPLQNGSRLDKTSCESAATSNWHCALQKYESSSLYLQHCSPLRLSQQPRSSVYEPLDIINFFVATGISNNDDFRTILDDSKCFQLRYTILCVFDRAVTVKKFGVIPRCSL